MTYTTYTTKTKAAKYDLPGIEDMVPNIWSPVKVAYDRYALCGISHWRQQPTNVKVMRKHGYGYLEEIVVRRADNVLYRFKEGDFPRLRINDIEDMLIIVVQNRLTNLSGDDVADFAIALRMFTRSLVIQKRVEDLQLRVKSYQKNINVTKPNTTRPDLRKRHPYTPYKDPQGFIYVDDYKRNKVLAKEKMEQFGKEKSSFHDQGHQQAAKGKKDDEDFGEIHWFNTTAGNPVKKILFKLYLSDHRSILMDSKEYLKMVMEAMKMEHYLIHIDYPVWEVIQKGNGPVSVTTDTNGVIKVLPPKTAKEILAREIERKARTTLLMALPEDHLAKFHKMTDAKEILHKGYDKFQSLLSQLEIHSAGVSIEDANQKFLSLSFDDLYNNLKVFDSDVKGSTGSSSSAQNVAFVSSESTSSTNDVSTAYGVSTSSGYNSQRENSSSYTDELIYSFFANQSSSPQLDHEDLRQVEGCSLMPRNQLALTRPKLSASIATKHGTLLENADQKEIKKAEGEMQRTLDIKQKTMGEDLENRRNLKLCNSGSDTEVTSCSKECVESYAKLKKLYDEQREQLGDASIEIQAYTQALKKVEAQLVAHQKNQLWYEEKIRFMKIDLDDKTDVLTYHKKLLAEAVKEKEELKTKLENFQSSSKGLSKLLNSQMSAKDKSGLGYGVQVHEGVLSYEDEVFQSVFDSRSSDVEDSLGHDRFANVEGMHAVPPLMTGNYMPPGPDREVDDSMFTYGPKQSKTSESDTQTSNFDYYESNSRVGIFYDNYGVHILVLEDGTDFYMLAKRRYPLIKETLKRMLALRLIVEYESEAVFDLLRFIQKKIDESRSHDGNIKNCKELAGPKLTALGKDISNPLIVGSLLKTIWLSMHHVIAMKHWLFQSKRVLGRIVGFQKFLQLSAATYTSYYCQFYLVLLVKNAKDSRK
ncbi:hypothetical protein Tco_0529249 [Tanacetum coccineum]